MLNVYVLERADTFTYDECVEQTIVAKDAVRAIELAKKEPGEWKILREVDLNVEQILTQDVMDG